VAIMKVWVVLLLLFCAASCEEENVSFCISESRADYFGTLKSNPSEFLNGVRDGNRVILRESKNDSFRVAYKNARTCSTNKVSEDAMFQMLVSSYTQNNPNKVYCVMSFNSGLADNLAKYMSVLASAGLRKPTYLSTGDTTTLRSEESCATMTEVQKVILPMTPFSIIENDISVMEEIPNLSAPK
jgi:hypothetical protein